MNFIEFLQN